LRKFWEGSQSKESVVIGEGDGEGEGESMDGVEGEEDVGAVSVAFVLRDLYDRLGFSSFFLTEVAWFSVFSFPSSPSSSLSLRS
jgi:hypothetical protein